MVTLDHPADAKIETSIMINRPAAAVSAMLYICRTICHAVGGRFD